MCDLPLCSASTPWQLNRSELALLPPVWHGQQEGRRRLLLYWSAFVFILDRGLLGTSHLCAGFSHYHQFCVGGFAASWGGHLMVGSLHRPVLMWQVPVGLAAACVSGSVLSLQKPCKRLSEIGAPWKVLTLCG